MVDGRHLEVRNPFSFLDDTFSMSTPQLKEKLLPVVVLRPHWFRKTMNEEEVSSRDPMKCALQHFMECKVLQQSKEALSFSHLDLHGFKEEQIDDGGHLCMDNISHVCVGHSLSHTHHDGRFFPTTYLDPYGIKFILEKIAFQHPM